MSVTAQIPAGVARADAHAHVPGRYLTDGTRLFRLLAAGPQRGFFWIEDCATLDVTALHSSQFEAWDMRPVGPQATAV